MITDTTEVQEQLQREFDDLRATTDAIDVGDFPKNDEMRTLCRFLRHRASLCAEAETIKEQMASMLKSIESRLKGLDYVYLPIVEPIVQKMLEGQKAKSIKTPWGNAGYRTLQQKLEIIDEDRLMRVADMVPAMAGVVFTPPRAISKANLNDYFKTTGDLPDGVELTPKQEKFYAA